MGDESMLETAQERISLLKAGMKGKIRAYFPKKFNVQIKTR